MQARPRTLLVVWHSRTGGAQQMARAAAAGAEAAEPEVAVRLLAADEAGAADVLAADALLLAAPENLGSLSGAMKDFLDRAYYDLLDRTNGLPWALMVCAGTDGAGAVRQCQRIATGLRLREAAAPLVVRTGAQTPEAIRAPKTIAAGDLARCAELGALLAVGVGAGVL